MELNAFTSGNIIAWIEDKLREHGIRKVVPDADTLTLAYQRAVEIELLKRQLQQIQVAVRAEAEGTVVPHDYRRSGGQAICKTDGPDDQVSSR